MREETSRVQPVSPYGVTKLAGEQLCFPTTSNHGVPTGGPPALHGLRPPAAARHGLPPVPPTAAHQGSDESRLYGDGEQTRDFTYVGDVAEAARLGAVQGVPGRVYDIGGGSRVSVNEVFRLIEQIVGCPVSIDRQPPQAGDMRDTFADTSLARTDLGFEPRTSLAEGLAAEYASRLKPSLPARRPDHTTDDACCAVRLPRPGPASPAGRLGACPAALRRCLRREGHQDPPGTAQPDQFLFERGNKALEEKKWFTAREFFQTLDIDTYPQSPHRADAKLGLADAYLGDGSATSQVLAINKYREFL